jgi:hypothetical protein
MKTTIRELRRLIRRSLIENGGGVNHKQVPYDGPNQPLGVTSREQLTFLNSQNLDTINDAGEDVELPTHLRDQNIDFETDEDIFGPCPPNDENVAWCQQDPYVNMSSPIPTSVMRGA